MSKKSVHGFDATPTLIPGCTIRDLSIALMDLNRAAGFVRQCEPIQAARVAHWLALPIDEVKAVAKTVKVKVSGMGGKKTIALQLALLKELPADPGASTPAPLAAAVEASPATGKAKAKAALVKKAVKAKATPVKKAAKAKAAPVKTITKAVLKVSKAKK